MRNVNINLNFIKQIANALEELNDEVVFVGGSVVTFYINDPAAEDVRPTKDIDVTLQIASVSELENFREKLITKGFTQTAEDNVICRFRYENIMVDVMSTKEVGWAPSNEWFEPGFSYLDVIEIDGIFIRILSLPYFIATKYTAFKNRGGDDPRTSHDLEDVIYIMDNQTDLVKIILEAPNDVLLFLKSAFTEIIKSDTIQEAILANLPFQLQTERFELIMNKLKTILKAD